MPWCETARTGNKTQSREIYEPRLLVIRLFATSCESKRDRNRSRLDGARNRFEPTLNLEHYRLRIRDGVFCIVKAANFELLD